MEQTLTPETRSDPGIPGFLYAQVLILCSSVTSLLAPGRWADMKKWFWSVAGLSLALSGSLAALAQTLVVPPPNILNMETINIKPYADGFYDKVASEYPALSRQLKDQMHVLAMEALTGTPRAMYFSGFDSFEALEKNEEWLPGDSAADAKLEALDARQAPYISDVQHTVWHYLSGLSNNMAAADIPHSHYWEVMIFHMRPGRGEQFAEITKLYRDANLKIGQNISWATYEGMMGVTDAYLVLVPMTSLKDEDTGLAHKKDFSAALGDQGRNRVNKLSEENVTSIEDNLWMVNPEWSYVEKSWIESDPQYWSSEPAARPAPKHATGATPAPKAPSAP
jgi:hypothetical protein